MSQATSPTLFAALTRRPGKESREAQQAAAKAARRQVLELVRNDWVYEPPSSGSATQSAVASRPDLDSDVVEWRTREQEDTSCSEGEDTKRKAGSRAKADPYRFENPDAVAQSLIERKARRRRRMQDEMQWNEGLRLWTSRRDAWTGAKAPSTPSAALEPVTTSDESAAGSSNDDESTDVAKVVSRDGTGIEKVASQDSTTQRQPLGSAQKLSSHTEDPEETLIPVVQPNSLYGNHARTPVNPNAYSTIYSRLIVQSNAPTVPLNLKHVTRALVHGWKANGEWPPKPTPRNDVPVRKRGAASAVSLGTDGTHEANGCQRTRRSGSLSETMKKMFHLRPGRRFHLRAPSRDGEGQVTVPVPEA